MLFFCFVWVYFIWGLIITNTGAAVVWVFIEKPFMDARRVFKNKYEK